MYGSGWIIQGTNCAHLVRAAPDPGGAVLLLIEPERSVEAGTVLVDCTHARFGRSGAREAVVGEGHASST